MLKPKMVFTVLAAWFAFHIFIFWVLNPTGVEALVESEKGQFMARVMGYIGGTLSKYSALIPLLKQWYQRRVLKLHMSDKKPEKKRILIYRLICCRSCWGWSCCLAFN